MCLCVLHRAHIFIKKMITETALPATLFGYGSLRKHVETVAGRINFQVKKTALSFFQLPPSQKPFFGFGGVCLGEDSVLRKIAWPS